MGMTASYTGHVRCVAITVAKPGCEAPLRAALEALVPATQAEAGYIRYELHQDLDEPRRFIILEECKRLDRVRDVSPDGARGRSGCGLRGTAA
jgi:hypothetical protein